MIVARRIFAQQLTARKLSAVKAGSSANDDVALFDFNAQLLALPAALQALNATFTRASTATVNQGGTLVTLASGQFGTDQDVDGLYDYVAEPAATNLLTYSSQYDDASWSKATYTVAPNVATAPDGTVTADAITSNGGTGSVTKLAISVSASTNYVFSFYAKRGTANNCKYSVHNQTAGADIVASTSYYNSINGSTFTRVIIPFTTPVGCTSINVYLQRDNSAAGTTYVWGAQLETGSRATSYIPTAAATATRAVSALSVPLANIPGFTDAQYTLFADCRMDSAPPTFGVMVSVEQDYSNRSLIFRNGAVFSDFTVSAGSTQSNMIGASMSTSRSRVAASHISGTHLSAQNGVAKSTAAGASMPPLTNLYIGASGALFNHEFNGRIRRAGLITRALTQAQINGLTL